MLITREGVTLDTELMVEERPWPGRETSYAGRLKRIGLTGYGDTPEAAEERVKQMFGFLVRMLRKNGTLPVFLERSGATEESLL